MPETRPQRIMPFEDFMRTLRSDAETPAYHGALAAARALGWVDQDLNIIGPGAAQGDH